MLRYCVLVVLLGAVATVSVSAEEVVLRSAPVVADEGRWFVTGANTTNIQVSAISVIGAALIGIAIALGIGGLLPVFTGAVGGASTFMGKRSLDNLDDVGGLGGMTGTGLAKMLEMLDGVRNLNVANVECQKKAVCEVQRQGGLLGGANVGLALDALFDAFTSDSANSVDSSPHLLRGYREASNRGKSKQDCDQVYSSCKYSVRKAIRSLNEE